MADAPTSSGPGAAFFVFLAISALVVLYFGQEKNPNEPRRGLLQQIVQTSSTNNDGGSSGGTKRTTKVKAPVIYLEGSSGAARSTISEEYLRIRAASGNKSPVNISGWELRSLTRFGLLIPAGVRTLYTGVVNPLHGITLAPGDVAMVHTGRSPLGVSFQANICSAYLNQYQDFNPPFSENDCPSYRDEEHLMLAAGLDNRCIDYIESLPKCRYPEVRLPSRLTQQCRDYIHKNLNYNACVGRYANRPDFYTGEWRVYLNQTRDLWKPSRESIFLLDGQKNLVDTLRY